MLETFLSSFIGAGGNVVVLVLVWFGYICGRKGEPLMWKEEEDEEIITEDE
jgi:hypothetical protein